MRAYLVFTRRVSDRAATLKLAFKRDNSSVKVVEDSLYILITAVAVAVLLIILAAVFPWRDAKAVVEGVLRDIEYMAGFVKGL
ncbi:hypothetical protein P186_2881 [Pyrobaculum ferrireducens]|uniref:Uncharacterized protein n=1 Tax=Pyrobaculum ferrireducens TaxID=1104324 RepID=G7VFQ1_9CREN|nr:hypothetical protein P186_2881 [Pyrobaculum ferrireducens]